MLLTRLKQFVSDKWPLILSTLLCTTLLFYAYGCEPKTKSLIDPMRRVTRAELQLELDTLFATSKLRILDLDRKDQIRDFVFQQVLISAQGGGVNPVGVITSLLAILGIGMTADDIRLRRERANRTYVDPLPKNGNH